MQCGDIQRDVDSFIDGELADPERREFESHLHECPVCQSLCSEQRRFKSELRRTLQPVAVPAQLRQRIEQSVAAEAGPQWRKELWQRLQHPLRVMLPVCAAGLALLWSYSSSTDADIPVESMIVKHQRNLPPEITGEPEVVRSWFDGKVPFAVPPPRLEPMASLRGARLSHVGDRDAALLQYEQHGRKISVFVFDPHGIHLMAPRRAVIGNREVYLQGTRGYQVAVFRDRDLGYAITGSIDEPDILELLSAAMGGR
ncbi:MAG: zf-HC2 domain-containing protein [Deltaproteobacteria bacterium]|jgi:anti-sigma factor RsiW|nr:zf-HC2 domain-containing protein [Deltaproteobacteria bacterium]